MEKRCARRQSGISLIELMIGMILGLILMGGAISIFLSSKRSYTEVEQASNLTENAQFAERIISDAILHVGFFGEVSGDRIERSSALTTVASDCTGNAAAYDLTNYLFAAVVANDGTALGCITDGVPGTHVLVVKSVLPRPLSDGPRDNPDPTEPTHSDGVIDTPTALSSARTYVMTNDTVGILFDGADTPPPSVLTGGEVPGGVAWAYQYQVFYIRNGATPQLSRKALSIVGGTMTVITEDLVEGVEEMRLRFGLDTVGSADGEVDTYTAVADMGSNWNRVGSVEISLLVRSVNRDPNFDNTSTYSLAGTSITPADKFRRVLLSTSMSLRNPKLFIRGGAA